VSSAEAAQLAGVSACTPQQAYLDLQKLARAQGCNTQQLFELYIHERFLERSRGTGASSLSNCGRISRPAFAGQGAQAGRVFDAC